MLIIISNNEWPIKKTTKHPIEGLHRLSRIRLGEDLDKSLFQNPRTDAGKVGIHASLNLQNPWKQVPHLWPGGSPWCANTQRSLGFSSDYWDASPDPHCSGLPTVAVFILTQELAQ